MYLRLDFGGRENGICENEFFLDELRLRIFQQDLRLRGVGRRREPQIGAGQCQRDGDRREHELVLASQESKHEIHDFADPALAGGVGGLKSSRSRQIALKHPTPLHSSHHPALREVRLDAASRMMLPAIFKSLYRFESSCPTQI
ncbi:hypothetical protein GGD83_004238 [Rhodoblastus sphagnicola]|nr:hypothetical protein [Rhodoblastus sphagnicola]